MPRQQPEARDGVHRARAAHTCRWTSQVAHVTPRRCPRGRRRPRRRRCRSPPPPLPLSLPPPRTSCAWQAETPGRAARVVEAARPAKVAMVSYMAGSGTSSTLPCSLVLRTCRSAPLLGDESEPMPQPAWPHAPQPEGVAKLERVRSRRLAVRGETKEGAVEGAGLIGDAHSPPPTRERASPRPPGLGLGQGKGEGGGEGEVRVR